MEHFLLNVLAAVVAGVVVAWIVKRFNRQTFQAPAGVAFHTGA